MQMTLKYIYLYLQQTLIFLSDISGWMTMRTKHISLLLVHPDYAANLPTPILNDRLTPPDTVRNLGVTSDSDFNFWKHIFWHVTDASNLFMTFAIFDAIFLFHSPKPLLQQCLLVGLVTETIFFITLHLKIFWNFSVFRTV